MPGGIIPIGPDIGGCMICPLPTGGNICGGGGPRIGPPNIWGGGIIGGPEPIPLGGGIQNCGATGVPAAIPCICGGPPLGAPPPAGFLRPFLGPPG